MTRPDRTLTTGEKGLLWWVTAFIAAVLGGWWWWTDINRMPEIAIPEPVMPAPNALDYYLEAGSLLTDQPVIQGAVHVLNDDIPKGWAGLVPTMARIEAAVTANGPAIARLREGFQHPYQAEPLRSFREFGPQHILSQIAETLHVEAELCRRRGDATGAMRSGLDCLEMAISSQRGCALLAGNQTSSDEALGRRTLWAVCHQLSARDTRASARRLERINAMRVRYAEILEEEKWHRLASLMDRFSTPGWRKHGCRDFVPSTRQWQLWGVKKRDVITDVTQYMDRRIANARRPYAYKLLQPALPDNPISRCFCISYGSYFFHSYADAQDSLLLVTLALQAYKLDHRRYPAALSNLVPDYLSAIPRDAFAKSGPLQYKLTKTGYLLYSVGPDGTDDGGTPSRDGQNPKVATGQSSLRHYSTGDIVAGVNVR